MHGINNIRIQTIRNSGRPKRTRTADEERRLRSLLLGGATGAADDPLADLAADSSGEAETVTLKILILLLAKKP